VLLLGGLLYLAAAAAGLVLVLPTREAGLFRHPDALTIVVATALVMGVATVWLSVHRRVAHRWFPVWIWGTQLPTVALISVGLGAAGPSWAALSLLYVEVPIVAVFVLRSAYASVVLATVIIGFSIVTLTQPGWPRPALQSLAFALGLGSIGYAFGQLLKRGTQEAQRLSKFRRFLPETVAGVVATSEADDLFEPHRSLITVVFCDLRGFTHFAATASPEDVRATLDEYFAVVGTELSGLGATVGAIHGDGIMAYFGDPLPQADSADRAVAFAVQVRGPMADLVGRWTSRGFQLSYGIGIAHGYATLGVVGFDGRFDYTALGPVVNLAARLSDAARPAETLIDKRTLAEVAQPPATVDRIITVKGFDEPMHVHVMAQ
jgi:class 3 adenylate cyclase